MSAQHSVTSQNRLLSALPARTRKRFLDDCRSVELDRGAVLHEQGEPVRHVYFPIDSCIAVITTIDRDCTLQVGMIGNEGMCEATLMQGNGLAALLAVVQSAGTAWKMQASTFLAHLASTPVLRTLLDRYVHVLLRQLAQAVACMRFHTIEKRLARWLLMAHDRANSDVFDLTQEFLAYRLGVRRVGITQAAGLLQSRRLIRYARGRITIVNRERLESDACSCYRSDLDAYRDGMGLASDPG